MGLYANASRCDSFLSLRILKEFKSVYIRVTSFTENSPGHTKQITATKRRSARAGRTLNIHTILWSIFYIPEWLWPILEG